MNSYLAVGETKNISENAFFPLTRGKHNNYRISQKDVRDEFKEFFMTVSGEVPWQYKHIQLVFLYGVFNK